MTAVAHTPFLGQLKWDGENYIVEVPVEVVKRFRLRKGDDVRVEVVTIEIPPSTHKKLSKSLGRKSSRG